MKKLLIACMMSLSSLGAMAQDGEPNDLRIVVSPESSAGNPIVSQGYYSASDPGAPEIISYTWELTPCDQDGSPAGAPVFSQVYPGTLSGNDFVFPGSENLDAEQNYLVGLSAKNSVGVVFTTSAQTFVSNVQVTCVSGVNSTQAEPGMTKSVSGNTLTLPVSYPYIYTITSAGQPLTTALNVSLGGTSIFPNTPFPMANNSIPIDFSFTVSQNAPLCTSQTWTLDFFNGNSVKVCTFTFTIFCRPVTKQTMVGLWSGIYYKGDDDYLHRIASNGVSWNYQAINPWGGWGSVQIAGWLTGDPTVDRVFFKGKDGGLYNIYSTGGPSWLLGIVGNGLYDVKSDVHMRGGEILYIANDNLIHRRYWANNSWNMQLISPVNGYQGVTAVGGMGFASSSSGNIFFRTSNNGIMNLFQNNGNWYSQLLPATIPCGGDMIFDDSQNTLYYRGTDNNIHNVNWTSSGWAYDAMTSANGPVAATNNLAHTQGEKRMYFKGNDGRLYSIWQQSNGQWRIDWMNSSYTGVAGDIVSASTNIYFNSTSKQICNYWFNNQATWPVSVLTNSAPSNAIGCSSLYRFAAPEENADAQAMPPATSGEAFDVFPNPNNGVFTIQLSSPSENTGAELFNLMGERVDAFVFTGTNHSYSPEHSLAPGIYLLRVKSDGQVFSKRIIIQ